MIQPLPNNDTQASDIPLQEVEKNNTNETVKQLDQKTDDNSDDDFEADSVKFIGIKKYNRSTLKKAATRNSLSIEISPVYQVI